MVLQTYNEKIVFWTHKFAAGTHSYEKQRVQGPIKPKIVNESLWWYSAVGRGIGDRHAPAGR